MKEFTAGDNVFFYNGARKERGVVFKVNKVTVRIQMPTAQIITLPQNLVKHDETARKEA